MLRGSPRRRVYWRQKKLNRLVLTVVHLHLRVWNDSAPNTKEAIVEERRGGGGRRSWWRFGSFLGTRVERPRQERTKRKREKNQRTNHQTGWKRLLQQDTLTDA